MPLCLLVHYGMGQQLPEAICIGYRVAANLGNPCQYDFVSEITIASDVVGMPVVRGDE